MAQPDYKPHERSPLAPCPMDRSVTFVKSECGCTVEGCGHLPDPVRPKLCAKHAAAPDIYAALIAFRALHKKCNRKSTDRRCDVCREADAALAKAEGRNE